MIVYQSGSLKELRLYSAPSGMKFSILSNEPCHVAFVQELNTGFEKVEVSRLLPGPFVKWIYAAQIDEKRCSVGSYVRTEAGFQATQPERMPEKAKEKFKKWSEKICPQPLKSK